MPKRPPQHMAPGAKTSAQMRLDRNRAHDARRRWSQPWRGFYKTPAWQAARQLQLSAQPLCERDLARGRIVPATVVNHRQAHKGDWSLFIDPANHESVCERCHNRDIQREERAPT